MCVRDEVDPGVSPVNQLALPRITAITYPGAYSVAFAPFHLTAFKNPGSYALAFCGDVPSAGGGVGDISVKACKTPARLSSSNP